MEPKGSLLFLQQPVESPCSEPDEFSPYIPSHLSKIHSDIILPHTPRFSKQSLCFRFSNQNFVCISHLCHAWYMPHPSQPPGFDYANNMWLKVQSIGVHISILFICTHAYSFKVLGIGRSSISLFSSSSSSLSWAMGAVRKGVSDSLHHFSSTRSFLVTVANWAQ